MTLETSVQKLEDLLLVTVPRDLMDSDVLQLRRQVLQEIRRHKSRWVLLDFSLVDICDSFFGRFIQSTAEMAELMGAEVIVSGLQDAVVETMVDLGMVLPNIHAVLDLDDALALSRANQQGPGELFDFAQDEDQDSPRAQTRGDERSADQGGEQRSDAPFAGLTEVQYDR